MKRTITIKGIDGEVKLEVVARVNTGNRGFTKDGSEKITRQLANNLFTAIANRDLAYVSFDATNITIAV